MLIFLEDVIFAQNGFVIDISVNPSVGRNIAVIISRLSQLNGRSNDL